MSSPLPDFLLLILCDNAVLMIDSWFIQHTEALWSYWLAPDNRFEPVSFTVIMVHPGIVFLFCSTSVMSMFIYNINMDGASNWFTIGCGKLVAREYKIQQNRKIILRRIVRWTVVIGWLWSYFCWMHLNSPMYLPYFISYTRHWIIMYMLTS